MPNILTLNVLVGNTGFPRGGVPDQWRIQFFSRGGVPTPEEVTSTYYLAKYLLNLQENERSWARRGRGGGRRLSLGPL